MTQSVPDSISRDALLRLQVNAEADFVPAEEAVIDYTALIIERVNDLVKEINCPTAWLQIADYCICQSTQWHQQRTDEYLSNKDADQALAWGADHQSLVLILAILRSID
jgi:hypothetical protein